jgi:hypothetical protein
MRHLPHELLIILSRCCVLSAFDLVVMVGIFIRNALFSARSQGPHDLVLVVLVSLLKLVTFPERLSYVTFDAVCSADVRALRRRFPQAKLFRQ